MMVVRKVSADPIKFFMKYFGIKADEAHLADVEAVGESIARLEEAVDNLKQREASITASVNPPAFILKFFATDFMKQVGVELSPITVPYPVYIFEYVSAGGNSSQRTTFTLNSPTIDALVETLSLKIRWKKSAAGQRAEVEDERVVGLHLLEVRGGVGEFPAFVFHHEVEDVGGAQGFTFERFEVAGY